jgi:hypothetical protein
MILSYMEPALEILSIQFKILKMYKNWAKSMGIKFAH